MTSWKPSVAAGLDWQKLDLSAEEGFVLSRLDGSTDVGQLAHVTGMAPEVLNRALDRLVDVGAVARPQEADPFPEDATTQVDLRAPELEAVATAAAAAGGVFEGEENAATPAAADTARGTAEKGEEDNDDDDERSDAEAAGAGEYRKLFETELHPRPADERAALAVTATGPVLLALCFDPDSAVIVKVLENATAGLEHARLVAMHHRNPVGLDALGRRAEFLRDGTVRRVLLRNPQLPDGLFNRVMQPRPLRDVYKAAIDRDVGERTKVRARTLLRQRFAQGQPEERVEVIMTSEGRVLALLSGMALDARTTSLLMGRTLNSQTLVQNLVRFPGVLPPLLAHLMKNPLVKRNPALRTAILQHPNAPSDLKRKG